MKKATILSGIDRLQLADEHLRGRRVGLMTNPTGMNRELKSTIDIVNERYHLTAMYAVEHGMTPKKPPVVDLVDIEEDLKPMVLEVLDEVLADEEG